MEELLILKDVCYETSGKFILEDIHLSITKRSFITITGVSGGGKSTLLKIMSSLLTPTKGEISYKGHSLQQLDLIPYRREVSYAFQQPVLFGETVYDNLAFPYEVRKELVNETRMVELLGFVQLDSTYLKQPIAMLSGGERQRIALLRNIMFPPQILLLDEVTTGLDEENKDVVNRMLQRIYDSGTALVRVTHDAEEIAAAERVLVMEGGTLHE